MFWVRVKMGGRKGKGEREKKGMEKEREGERGPPGKYTGIDFCSTDVQV